jgi:uncharacterized membrane protein YhaH (DUF805 family)
VVGGFRAGPPAGRHDSAATGKETWLGLLWIFGVQIVLFTVAGIIAGDFTGYVILLVAPVLGLLLLAGPARSRAYFRRR